MRRGLFITATDTGVGKTWVTRGLARLAVDAGLSVAALKPIETGVQGHPEDALAIGRAARREALAFAPGLARRERPVSPYAAELAGEAPLELDALLAAIDAAAAHSELLLVEGAGGLFVPLDQRHDTSALAMALELPVLLVAPNRLGVLSHVIAATTAARSLGIDPVAVVLTPSGEDPSAPHNALILREHLSIPVHVLSVSDDDDDALAECMAHAGLEHYVGLGRATLT